MADSPWNRWKVTAFALMILFVTVLATGLVVANRGPSDGGNPKVESGTTSGRTTGARAVGQATRRTAAPTQAQAPQNVSVPQPVTRMSVQDVVAECNRSASTQVGPHDKAWEVAKDAIIGGAVTAGIGAAGGAIAGGGKGAGKGAAIGGAVGVAGGALYGINENRKHDEAYRAAYARCMQSRGYAG
jgi:hypothetical protein